MVRYRLVVPVIRSPHPPEFTARGVAIGVGWAVTPLVGLQTLLMIATWQVLKRVFRKDSSMVQALIWSWVNNPATMIPMYYVFYVTGLWLLGKSGSLGGYDTFSRIWDQAAHEPTVLAQGLFVAREFGAALLVGCIPYTLIATALSYKWSLTIVRRRQRRLRLRRAETFGV